MHLQPIRYRGRLAAAATADRFILSEHVEHRPPGDLAMVTFMCVYAREIALSRLPGPYTDPDARRFAQACLPRPVSANCSNDPTSICRGSSRHRDPEERARPERTERTS